LYPEAQLLKTIEINAVQQRGEQKGDTTQFNADAFKVNTDATVQDLIRKMPGVTLDNNQIKINGEQVQKVLLDGKPFLGEDPNAALRQLPAEIIDKVEFFDKMSDQAAFTGFNDGDQQKTINLVSKKSKQKGTFGKINGAMGAGNSVGQNPFDARYQSAVNYNNFEQKNRLTLLGMFNNINQQNFSASDLGGLGNSGNSRSSTGGGGGRSDNTTGFSINPQSGIIQTQALGSNHTFQNDRLLINSSYFFNASNTINQTDLRRQYYTSDQIYSENQSSSLKQMTHRTFMRLEWTLDSSHKIIFTPNFNLQTQDLTSSLSSTNQILNTAVQNSIASEMQPKSLDFNPQILWQFKFSKKGRTLSLNTTASLSERLQKGFYTSEIDQNNSISDLNQNYGSYLNTQRISGQLSYTEPMGRYFQWQWTYHPGITQHAFDRNYYDRSAANFELYNAALSNSFNYSIVQQKTGAALNFQKGSFNGMLNADFLQNELNGNVTLGNPLIINRVFTNLLPGFQCNYKFDKSRNFRLYYRTSTTLPTVNQLQPVLDLSNSNQIKSGNPELKQSIDHSLSFRLGGYQSQSARNIMWFFRSSWSESYITSSTRMLTNDTVVLGIPLNKYTLLTQPENMNGYWNARTYITYGFPVSKLKSNLNVNSGLVFGSTPSRIRDQNNASYTRNLNLGLVWSSNISAQIDLQASYNTSFNYVENQLSAQATHYFNETVYGKFHFEFLNRGVFELESNYTHISGLSSGYNQEFWLLNGSLGYRFLERKNLELKAYVFDLLNQNKNIVRSLQNNYWDDTQSLTLTRYVQFGLFYTFRKFNGTPKTYSEEERVPEHFMPPGMRPPR
jgi:hypothetical protein